MQMVLETRSRGNPSWTLLSATDAWRYRIKHERACVKFASEMRTEQNLTWRGAAEALNRQQMKTWRGQDWSGAYLRRVAMQHLVPVGGKHTSAFRRDRCAA